MVRVRLKDVSVRTGDRLIVDGISLDISAGEIVTLIGPNGAGKTTIARLAAGLAAATSGAVWRADGLRIGYVPQRFRVDPSLPLTVARLAGLTGRHANGDIHRALTEVGAAHLESRQVSDLSGGELQRVLLARAFLGSPDVLILDEPTQGIDFRGQEEFYNLVRRTRDTTGCGVLLVSHDVHVVMAASDKVVCVNGHICCQGTPEAIDRDPAYEALFGPRYRGALAVFHHHHDHDHGLKQASGVRDGEIHDGGSP